jgi:formylmethanofuran dehydrogenase subunit E
LDYQNGKVALILSNDGKRAIRVRSEKEPKYLDKMQKFANDFLSDYAKKIKK